jgi:UDP-N-acetyl-D-mannosaminuronic acid dehydrogenase
VGKEFIPSNDFSLIREADIIFLTLGTPVDGFLNPDYSQLDSAIDSLMPFFREGQLLSLRSTISPGTTEYLKEYIESKSNLKIGENFFLVFCPERIAQGYAITETKVLPEIVGGIDKKSTEKLMEFFKEVGKEAYATTAINAELLKLFNNMNRYINFAIANEFMVLSENWGGDIHEIIRLANKNYPRGGLKLPGFTAGPCLFKDGFFLTSGTPFPDLITAAWTINESMPGYLVNRVKKMMPLKNKKCLILGMSFKANNDDQRASLSHKLRKALKKEMANVAIHDVHTHEEKFENLLKDSDIVFLAAPHDEYRKEIDYYKLHLKQDATMVDIWNVFNQNKIIFQPHKI